MDRVHHLKTDAVIWDAVERGEKTFEVRRNDRFFQRGDIVRLYRSTEDAGWKSAQFLDFRVGWTLMGGQYGVEHGYVVFSLEPTP